MKSVPSRQNHEPLENYTKSDITMNASFKSRWGKERNSKYEYERRVLQKKIQAAVGQSWSELRAKLKKENREQVWEYHTHYIELNCYRQNGIMYDSEGNKLIKGQIYVEGDKIKCQ